MGDDTGGLRALQRAIWSAGDPDAIAELFWDVGAAVAEAAAIAPGMAVLDVATGTGNAAIRAAELGSQVVGLDITPELFVDARRREALAGVSVEWVEGDAQALPFEDASFDRVLSTFGVMFAPDHELAAAELVRTCRPGGTIVLASWTPTSPMGRLFAAVCGHDQATAPAPTLWGDESYLRGLLGGRILMAIERRSIDVALAPAGGADDGWQQRFGPLVLARELLDAARYEALAAELREHAGTAADGGLRLASEYLLVVGLKP